MKINFIEALVLWIIFLSCVGSMAVSFVDYVCPLSVEAQRAQMEPTLELFSAYGLADARGRR